MYFVSVRRSKLAHPCNRALALSLSDMQKKITELNLEMDLDYDERRHYRLFVSLTGSPHALHELTQMIKQLVAKFSKEGDQVRAIHELAVATGDATKVDGWAISLLETPHQFDRRQHIGILMLNRNLEESCVRMLIGKGRAAIAKLEKDSQCKIIVVQQPRTIRDHVRVVGNHEQGVAQGLHLVKSRLENLVEYRAKMPRR